MGGWDDGHGCWKGLWGRFDPLCWETWRQKKKKQDGRLINSLASGWALHSMLPQHFQADYLKPHFFSISNLTATGSVTAVVLCVILFLNCCWLLSIPAWNSQEGEKKPSYFESISHITLLISSEKKRKFSTWVWMTHHSCNWISE